MYERGWRATKSAWILVRVPRRSGTPSSFAHLRTPTRNHAAPSPRRRPLSSSLYGPVHYRRGSPRWPRWGGRVVDKRSRQHGLAVREQPLELRLGRRVRLDRAVQRCEVAVVDPQARVGRQVARAVCSNVLVSRRRPRRGRSRQQ